MKACDPLPPHPLVRRFPRVKKIPAAVLGTAILVGLTACGKTGTEDGKQNKSLNPTHPGKAGQTKSLLRPPSPEAENRARSFRVNSAADLGVSLNKLAASHAQASPEELRELLEAAYAEWIYREPEAFFKAIMSLGDEDIRTGIVAATFHLLSLHDPAAAESMLGKIPGRYTDPSVLASIAVGYSTRQPALLSKFLSRLSSADKSLLAGNAGEIYRAQMDLAGAKGGFPGQLYFPSDKTMEAEALKSLLKESAGQPGDLGQLDEWRKGTEKAGLPEVYLAACRAFASSHPEQAEGLLASQSPTAKESLLEGLSKADPAKACTLALDTGVSTLAFKTCFLEWLEVDSQTAGAWIYSIQDGELKTSSILGMADWLETKGDAETAAALRGSVATHDGGGNKVTE